MMALASASTQALALGSLAARNQGSKQAGFGHTAGNNEVAIS